MEKEIPDMDERVGAALERLAEIPSESVVPEPFRAYFEKTASFLLSVKKDADNRSLYEDILPENYESSYANPDYAVRMLGGEMGKILSAVYYSGRKRKGQAVPSTASFFRISPLY